MTQNQLNRFVARATGESLRRIRRMGFTLAGHVPLRRLKGNTERPLCQPLFQPNK